MRRTVILLSGGEGKRLWPITRKDRSKQESHFIRSESTFDKLYKLLVKEYGAQNIIVSSGRAQRDYVLKVIEKETKIWIQPTDRNNSAGILFALMESGFELDYSLVALIPTDQIILDDQAFIDAINLAFEAAERNQMFCAIGTTPDRINTSYGHLHIGPVKNKVNRVRRFVEKPGSEEAKEMVDSGEYLWNTGIYVVPARLLQESFEEYLPAIYRGYCQANKPIDQNMYDILPSISIDYGIIERIDDLLCVEAHFHWLDVGTYRIISHYLAENSEKNQIEGDVVDIESRRNLVIAQTRPVVLNGVNDLIVIDFEDVLFICSKERMEQIKNLVKELRARGREDLL